MTDAPPPSADEVAHRGFTTSFRGFNPAEVRAFMARVAGELRAGAEREAALQAKVAELEHRLAHPVIDDAALTQALGEETSRVLASARAAAHELRARAEDNAARILREAHEEAERIRARAEVVLADRTEEAEGEAAKIRQAAEREAAALVENGRRELEAARAKVEARARQMLREAREGRAKVLGDLSRRRKVLETQVEQLRAGRERLLEAYRLVRRSVDEVTEELEKVEGAARQAAEEAGRRMGLAEARAEGNGDGNGHDDAAVAEAAMVGPTPPPAPSPPAAEPAPEPGTAAARRVSALRIRRLPATEAAPPPPPPGPAPEPATEPAAVPNGQAPPEVAEVEAQAVETHAPGAEAVEEEGAEPSPSAAEAGAGTEQAAAAESTAGIGRPPVDELFARLRANATEQFTVPDPAAERAEQSEAEPRAPASGPPDQPAATLDESLLEQRDAALEGIEAKLARKLKRALQDEQNEILDRLRSARGGLVATELLPSTKEQSRHYRSAAEESLKEAAAAGVAFASGEGPAPDVSDVVAELAEELVRPLSRRLIAAMDGAGDDDRSALTERIGAAYRELKTHRSERLAGDCVIAAFSLGSLSAVSGGRPLRWVVDDQGGPCPDCDDNALAGPTPGGDAFPTGQTHPPAHAGCRCLLVPTAP